MKTIETNIGNITYVERTLEGPLPQEPKNILSVNRSHYWDTWAKQVKFDLTFPRSIIESIQLGLINSTEFTISNPLTTDHCTAGICHTEKFRVHNLLAEKDFPILIDKPIEKLTFTFKLVNERENSVKINFITLKGCCADGVKATPSPYNLSFINNTNKKRNDPPRRTDSSPLRQDSPRMATNSAKPRPQQVPHKITKNPGRSNPKQMTLSNYSSPRHSDPVPPLLKPDEQPTQSYSELLLNQTLFLEVSNPGLKEDLQSLIEEMGGRWIDALSDDIQIDLILSDIPSELSQTMSQIFLQVVLRAEWLLDSLEERELLPYDNYHLFEPQVN